MTLTNSRTEAATPVAAILLVFTAGLLFAAMDTAAKYLVLAGMSPLFVSWVRFTVHAVLVAIYFQGWRNPAMYRTRKLPAQLLRGVFLYGSTIFNFMALATLQLAQTMSIFFFAPMLITALAGPMLGEWAGWRRWAAIISGFAGVIVITRPGFGAFELGHLYTLGAMASYSFYVIMTRSMSATETASSLIFYSALTPAVLILPTVPFTASTPPDMLCWLLLLGIGFVGAVAHYCLVLAYRQATTTALAPYPYLQMVWMIAFGFLVFSQFPDGWTLVGAAIVVVSGLYIVYRERELRLSQASAPNAEEGSLAKKL